MTAAERCRSEHPLDFAHSPTLASNGQVVYVVCGLSRCQARKAVSLEAWKAELTRRRTLSEGVQVWHARGDRLVPVAPDVDGRLPTPGGRRP